MKTKQNLVSILHSVDSRLPAMKFCMYIQGNPKRMRPQIRPDTSPKLDVLARGGNFAVIEKLSLNWGNK